MISLYPDELTYPIVDSTTSISYKELPGLPFNNTYIDGTGSAGHYGTDVLFFGGVTLQNATFGLAETPGLHTTMFGIGPDPDLYSRKPLNTTIVSTLDALVAAGVTKSKLLSLYLNELNSPSGSIVFGGVDESKFDTNAGFVTLDILRDPLAKNQVRDFYLVQMTKLSVMLNDKTETIPISSSPSMPWLPVSVDSGSSFTMVPSQFFQTINTYVNATYFPELQGYGLPCVAAQNETLKNTIVSWTPGDPLSPSVSITYNISVADLVVPLYNIGTTTPVTATFDGKEMAACAFGIQPSYEGLDGLGVIGMPFLRRMYVVFDQDNEEISFGYPTFNADDSNIVEVQKISGSPYAKQVESQSDADASTQTLFSFYNVTSSSNVTSTATGSGLTGPTVSSGAPRTGAVAVIVAIVAAAAGFALGM